jgi:exosortase/archaeosortase family protein
LFIVSLVAADMFLVSRVRKAILVLSVIPIAIFKNAVRIVTLSLLGAYVDRDILSSVVHQRGGIPIFFLALCLLATVLWILRKNDSSPHASRSKK